MPVKKKVGRPKTKFTQEQVAKIEECAFHGCQTKTIETLTGIPENTLRRNFGELLAKKRAERKLELRKAQDKRANAGDTGMLCFLGKNELGQTDKKDPKLYGTFIFVRQNYGSSRRKKANSPSS